MYIGMYMNILCVYLYTYIAKICEQEFVTFSIV